MIKKIEKTTRERLWHNFHGYGPQDKQGQNKDKKPIIKEEKNDTRITTGKA